MSAAACLNASGACSFTLPLPHPYGFAMPVFIQVSSKNTISEAGIIFDFLCIQPFFRDWRAAAAPLRPAFFFAGVPKPFDDGVSDSVAAAGKLQFLHNLRNRR
jgi:hypothetical protein